MNGHSLQKEGFSLFGFSFRIVQNRQIRDGLGEARVLAFELFGQFKRSLQFLFSFRELSLFHHGRALFGVELPGCFVFATPDEDDNDEQGKGQVPQDM